ncbi:MULTISPECIES: hypothetical protein [unclassified Lentimonas]|uniref:hypothetical protein n=1 Tax=unclassified Lentimonas TaxID=2630993 RepID=UPI00138988F8|nr:MULTISPECIES: hypothetical protein [unclassified Lentimonas]
MPASSATQIMHFFPLLSVFKRFAHICFKCSLLLFVLIQVKGADKEAIALQSLSINQLETQLADMESEHQRLASLSLRSGSGTIGYRSMWHLTPLQKEWVEIELGEISEIDQIVLVPTLWRSSHINFDADAFPKKFKIIAGTARTYPEGTVIAEYDGETAKEIGIAPVIIPIEPTTMASWVRIETSELSLREFDDRYIFQLSELLIFSGNRNLALKRPVKYASQTGDIQQQAWDAQNLTDGATPYMMDAGHGLNSLAYITHLEVNPTFNIDLGESYPVSQIHLHVTEQSDTVPRASGNEPGIPKHLKIEGANQADFSDAILLIDEPEMRTRPSAPILMWNLPQTECRYIRIYDGSQSTSTNDVDRLGFAEVEIFSGDQNVALGSAVTVDLLQHIEYRKPQSLTDGNNLYGAILPIRQWMEELSRGQELEYAIPRVQAELTQRYRHQKAQLRIMGWLITALIAAVIIVFLISHNLRLRQFSSLKKRIAADLHDELGANIHTIGLLSDAAQVAHESPDQLKMLHTRIRNITESTGRAIEHSTNMLESTDMNMELIEEFRRTSRRFSGQVAYQLTVTGEDDLTKLKPKSCMDLLLFYKECLVNITRHSSATQMTAELIGEGNLITLIVTDNGTGIAETSDSVTPSSLKRRADLMKAQLRSEGLPEGGTRITLIYKSNKLGYIR